jgi:cellulose synthase/poly-beta-1,6-N-acetylglucosamine synthase-like glycosyltransferase
MQFWELTFVVSCFIIFYNYAGYALIAVVLNKLKRPPLPDTENFTPSVSFIVAAYNEEDFIREKILNSLRQDYPVDRIEFIFISDGSSDRTPAIIGEHPSVKLLHQPQRNGKSHAINRAVATARNEVLIFSDANTTLNDQAVRNIARHYKDPKTGGVAGEKKVISAGTDEVGGGEGLYWKYESFLKKIDSDFYSVVGAAGELFSVRRELYHPLPGNIILDDFVISLETAQKGYRIIYEPEAYAMESPSFSMKDESKRKVRIAAGGFQAIGILSSLLAFWKQPRLSFLYISHRVLRWTLSPLCFILAFISNLVLAVATDSIVYRLLFGAQLLFYIMAALASVVPPSKRPGILKLPYYFTFMNISVVLGFFRFLKGGQSAAWEKAKRVTPSSPEGAGTRL